MRFVQFGDAHLDSSISGRLNLPQEKRDILRGDIRGAVTRACNLARDAQADLVLIPGDLFDYECLCADTTSFLLDLMRQMAPIRVFISPGNHDSLKPGSPYGAASGVDWPANAHVFRNPQLETVEVDGLGTVTGIAHVHRGVTDRVLASARWEPRPPGTHIVVFHGSRDGYAPSEKEVVIPFSDTELLAQGFTYAAIGHYHSYGTIEDTQGIRGAYSGCLQGRGLDETGVKIAVLGEIENGRVTLETVEVAERRIVPVEVSATGASDAPGLATRVDRGICAAGCRKCDVVYVRLTGSLAQETCADWAALADRFDYFHVCIDAGYVEPDYDLEAQCGESVAGTVKSEFARRMRDMMQTADDEQRRIIRDAAFYGLCALDGRRLEPRDVD